MGATRGHKAQIKRVWAKVVTDSQEAASEIGQKTASQLWGFIAAQQHHLQSMPTASDCEISQKVQAAGAPHPTCVLPLCSVLRIIRGMPSNILFFPHSLCGSAISQPSRFAPLRSERVARLDLGTPALLFLNSSSKPRSRDPGSPPFKLLFHTLPAPFGAVSGPCLSSR